MNNGHENTSSSFELLHPEIKRWIWESKWESLHDAQERAIPLIISGDSDVIISASTAAGKTEAAFLPILSRLAGLPEEDQLVIQISPLKSLINDQALRLEVIAERLNLPVYPWHGDAAQAGKKTFLKNPRGILLITPESLEAILVNKGSSVQRLFARAQYFVIDEIHIFIGQERGRQLVSLMHRIELAIGRKIARIGLSATLGDILLAGKFLRADRPVEIIESKAVGVNLKIALKTYTNEVLLVSRGTSVTIGPDLDSASRTGESGGGLPDHSSESQYSPDDQEEQEEPEEISDLTRHIYEKTKNSKNLIFPNSRKEVENYTAALSRLCELDSRPNSYFPHHGNLNKELRHDVEAMLKNQEQPTNAVCTSTMEVGVDFGSVRSIAQVGTPPSVSSLRQRLGRSGRKRGESSILWAYALIQKTKADTPPRVRMHPTLLASLATIQLLIKGWYEPPSPNYLHLSTLVHQMLSSIAQYSSRSAKQLWYELIETGSHKGLNKSEFRDLIINLGRLDLISQDADGSLLLGQQGEKFVNNYEFYSVFPLSDEYRIEANGKVIGTITKDTPIINGQKLIFAGRRWKVVEVLSEQAVIRVEAARGGKAVRFGGDGADVHQVVAEEMKCILESDDAYPYADEATMAAINESRQYYKSLGLAVSPFVQFGKEAYWFHWGGTRLSKTFALALKGYDLYCMPMSWCIEVNDISVDRLKEIMQEIIENPDWGSLLSTVEVPLVNRWDWALTPELRYKDYVARSCDFPSLEKGLRSALNNSLDDEYSSSIE